MITIKKGWDLSINDLLLAKEKGLPIFKTSHVGNLNTSSLYPLSLGFEDIIWDITQIDYSNSKPWLKISSKSGSEILTSVKPYFDHKKIACYGFTNEMKSVANVHFNPLQNKNVSSIAITILLHWDKIEKMLLSCNDVLIQDKIFGLKINPNGFLCKCTDNLSYNEKLCSFKKLLEEIKLLTLSGITDKVYGGYLVSFNCISLLLYYCKFWETDKNIVFDLSGSRMINYLTSSEVNSNINYLHSRLEKCCDFIPRIIEVVVVPTESFKIARPDFLENSLFSTYRLTKLRRSQLSTIDEYPRKVDNDFTFTIAKRITDYYSSYNCEFIATQHDNFSFVLEDELMDYSAAKLNNLYLRIVNSKNSYNRN